MATVDVDDSSLGQFEMSLFCPNRLAQSMGIGNCLAQFYISQMNWVNARNDFVMTNVI